MINGILQKKEKRREYSFLRTGECGQPHNGGGLGKGGGYGKHKTFGKKKGPKVIREEVGESKASEPSF